MKNSVFLLPLLALAACSKTDVTPPPPPIPDAQQATLAFAQTLPDFKDIGAIKETRLRSMTERRVTVNGSQTEHCTLHLFEIVGERGTRYGGLTHNEQSGKSGHVYGTDLKAVAESAEKMDGCKAVQ